MVNVELTEGMDSLCVILICLNVGYIYIYIYRNRDDGRRGVNGEAVEEFMDPPLFMWRLMILLTARVYPRVRVCGWNCYGSKIRTCAYRFVYIL